MRRSVIVGDVFEHVVGVRPIDQREQKSAERKRDRRTAIHFRQCQHDGVSLPCLLPQPCDHFDCYKAVNYPPELSGGKQYRKIIEGGTYSEVVSFKLKDTHIEDRVKRGWIGSEQSERRKAREAFLKLVFQISKRMAAAMPRGLEGLGQRQGSAGLRRDSHQWFDVIQMEAADGAADGAQRKDKLVPSVKGVYPR